MKNKFLQTVLSLCMVASVGLSVGCGGNGGDTSTGGDKVHEVSLLLNGWTNTPTSANDPYRAWVKENYGLDVKMTATADFTNSVTIGFSSKNKPNIISFPDFTSFQKIRTQGVLMEDWGPWIEKMPNFKKMLDTESQAFTKQVLTDEKGNINAIWTPATPPTWSLKIREDWANEYRATTVGLDKKGNETTVEADIYVPAGATATDGDIWMPNSPEDLLNFARWIKVEKNEGLARADYFGFTTAGGGNSLGTLETWMPLMWGRVPVAPYGFYVDSNNTVQFSTTDGTYEYYLDYLKQICDEELIDPSWFSQQFSDDKRTTYGKIGIQWYPGSITSSTQIDANAGNDEDNQINTVDWWKTYPLPRATEGTIPEAGFMAGEGLAGNIITVSKQTSMNTKLMEKICAFIDDCYAYYDEEQDKYFRGAAYDALRWGVGVESSISYQEIEGTNLLYCNTAGDKNTYRGSYSGAWDWGAWISSSYDGVVQGTDPEITEITRKVAEHDMKTAEFKTTPQIGEFLILDSNIVTDMVSDMVSFAYKYAKGETSMTVAQYCESWKTKLKGNELLAEATAQYKALGLMK